MDTRSETETGKQVALALQGGGAHGAFTWGVLDRLLEDGRIGFEAISGTSAGAMNAVVLADGLARNGNRGARERLHLFWEAVSDTAKFTPVRRAPLDVLLGSWSLDASPGFNYLDALSKFASPYELNPLNINPLRDLLEETVDFRRVRACGKPLVFISCTNVETGRVKVFHRDMISPEVVMASACLPLLFQAVEIDGVPYWDGGYMGNPVLFPFHDSTATHDYVIVQINPIFRKGAPKTAREIINRVNEISFNASLLLELRSIDFARRLIDEGKLDPKVYKRINIHIISNDKELVPLGASSKFNAEWAFLEHLFEVGRATADAWLDKVYPMLGVMPSADVREMYHGEGPDPQPSVNSVGAPPGTAFATRRNV
jgi:NTE family protein